MLQVYQPYRYEETIGYEYLVLLSKADSPLLAVPSIERLADEIYTTLRFDMADDAIQEAIDRKEHIELFGLSAEEFTMLARQETLPSFELPRPNVEEVEYHVYRYVQDKCICFRNYNQVIVHSPYGDGVW